MTGTIQPGRPGRPITDRSRKAKRRRAQYRAQAKRGLCACCDTAAMPGHKLCIEHRAWSRGYQFARRTTLAAVGRCGECKWPAQGKARCLTCAMKRNQRPSRQAAYRREHEYPGAP